MKKIYQNQSPADRFGAKRGKQTRFDFGTTESLVQEKKSSQQANLNVSHLKSFEFDKFLESIDNKEMFIAIVIADVPRVQPAICINCLCGGFWIVKVPCRELGLLRHSVVNLALNWS